MDKWTQKEMLCNSRGLDDGYVYIHKDHELSQATSFILTSGEEYTKKKFSLAEIDVSRITCFFGYLRKPLSNEIYDFDSNSIVPLPKTANRISRTTETFADPVEPNEAVCFAFTEPTIASHKSAMLRGAVVPQSILTDEDRRIRRPRLNRGGGTIGNMGGNNKSHQSGYGSMNISSYERDLANRTGRGRQMNQAGTRTWGSMEPTPKHQRFSPPPMQQAPMMQRWQAPPRNAFPPPNFPPPTFTPPNFPPPPPSSYPQLPGHPQVQQAGLYRHQQQQQHSTYQSNPGAYNQQAMRAIGRQQPQQHTQQRPPYQSHQPAQPAQNGYSFRQQGGAARPGNQQRQQQQSGGRANLNNLRAQLLSTLQKNRQNK